MAGAFAAEELERLRREEFPVSQRLAYLDHAAVSPMPSRTAALLGERIAALQDPSLEQGHRERYFAEAQARLGRLMNAPAKQIALLTNLGEAMATVANGLDLRPGEEIVIPGKEFSSLVYPWLLQERRGAKVVWVPKSGPATDLDRIAAAITPRTRVVAVSHVEFLNGFRHDMPALGRLCRDRNVLLAVDVTQSLGVLPGALRHRSGVRRARGPARDDRQRPASRAPVVDHGLHLRPAGAGRRVRETGTIRGCVRGDAQPGCPRRRARLEQYGRRQSAPGDRPPISGDGPACIMVGVAMEPSNAKRTMDNEMALGQPASEAVDAETPGLERNWSGVTVYTIGHSTRPQDELIAHLRHYDVATLVDVRTMPRSRRNPQFNADELAAVLPGAGIAYAHLPRLGGLRRRLGDDSPNAGWRNASFRAYADYMQTAAFREGLDELHALTEAGPAALMCAEVVPWRCHRSLIADALLVRGVVAREIQSLTRATEHALTPFARVDGLAITYPPPHIEGPETGG